MFRFLSVEVVHWDYWERFTLPLESNVITVVGPNGSGKTTLLDLLRTLLCIECSSGRDYKRYVRRNDKPFSWLRAVVDNERLNSGSRPFFPLLDDRITLACQIRKKGGDWQRQYLIAGGDVPIEKLEEQGSWIGVRDYRMRLEQAGLTGAIRHVLSLEQGDTDKLCEYSPRQLLELVFSVFGDQEVLDNYQQAKNEQIEIGRELEKLEEELARLGIRLREAEANVNSFREWEKLKKDHDRLSMNVLPCAELAEIGVRIAAGRNGLHKKRGEIRALQQSFEELQKKKTDLEQQLETAQGHQKDLRDAERVAKEHFDHHFLAAHDAEKVLKDKAALEEMCRQQERGFDAAAKSAEQREKQEQLAAGNHELKMLRQQIRDLQARLNALRAGEKLEPRFVQEFRGQLATAGIAHNMLTEIVEVTDPDWQKAVEGVLGPFSHIVLLQNPGDRARAWELGEKLRYRNFIVADRAPLPRADRGSLLEVVRFAEPAPDWMSDLLNRIQRVETVQEGSALGKNVTWITREGYHRERRGGRYIGVDPGNFQFGEGARKSLIDGTEKELATLLNREKELVQNNHILERGIDGIQALLVGLDAARQMAARAAEFGRVEKEFPLLSQRAAEAGQALADIGARLNSAREACSQLHISLRVLEGELKRDEKVLQNDMAELRTRKKELAEKIVHYRALRRPMPPEWYTREALEQLRREYESPEAVKRDMKRLRDTLEEGTWITDPQVVAVRDKLQGDYDHLGQTIKGRHIHHHRHMTATVEARESYINVLRATVRRYSRNVRSLGELAGIGVEVEPPHLVNEDVALSQAGLNVKFDFDQKGMIGLNDGEASGGQQVMKSLILLVGLLMDESRSGGFVFIDEPFAHLDVFNIDKVGAFLKATKAQYVLTTPNTHNVNVFKTSDLTLVTQKRRHPEKWAPPVAFLRRQKDA